MNRWLIGIVGLLLIGALVVAAARRAKVSQESARRTAEFESASGLPSPDAQVPAEHEQASAADPSARTDVQWRALLTPEQYYVTRQKGTEPKFTGEYWNTKTDGTYHCVGCGTPLFDSETKYDSGTGWPSFYAPIAEDDVRQEEDYSLFAVRTEVLCRRCDSHLGHVFPDGPPPTGLRYCINSAALKLEPR